MNWVQIFVQILPAIEAAITAIMKAEGKTPEQATAAFLDHITPGQPNSSALS